MKRFRQTHRYQLESLESRRLLSALIVSSAADSGSGSLRAQIAAAQSGDNISFAPGLTGQTITLTSGYLSIAKNLAIQGLGADRLTISGNDASMVFWIMGSATNVQIRDLTITRGAPAIANAGVLSVSNCALTANFSDYGGAISNSGTLNLSGSTLSDNYSIGHNYNYAAGGAIYSGAGAVTVSNCTIANNSALGGQVLIYDPDSGAQLGFQGTDAYGGGLYIAGGTASIDHSTLFGNYAIGGYSSEGLPLAAGYSGGVGGGQISISNSIIAGNHADYSPDGGFTSLGHNLIGNSSGATFAASDLLDVNPQLGPLQNNGGSTQTMALLAGSPAINAGDNTNAGAFDQRGVGFARIVGGTIDIGAFEGGVAGKTWIGPAIGGSWSTAANWSPSGAPEASDLVTISGKSVNLSASTTFASLTLTGGATLTLAPNGSRVLRTSTLFISANSKLNLNDNDLILNYTGDVSPIGSWNGTAYTGITGLIQSGRTENGTWDGSGITTSMSDAASGVTTLGVADAAELLGISGNQTGLWNGQTVDATTVVIKYTYTGDVNFDGFVDAADYGVIDNWVQFPGTSGYANGDFNYDGVIDAGDYGYIDNNIQVQGAPL